MAKQDVSDYLNDILQAIVAISNFTKNITYEDFEKDLKTQYAVIKAIEIIGEAARSIPYDFKRNHPKIPWKNIVGMRDKLVHDYMGIDLPTVWDTAAKNIPKLKDQIEEIV